MRPHRMDFHGAREEMVPPGGRMTGRPAGGSRRRGLAMPLGRDRRAAGLRVRVLPTGFVALLVSGLGTGLLAGIGSLGFGPGAAWTPDAAAAPSLRSLEQDKTAAQAAARQLVDEVTALNDRLKAAGARYAELQQQLVRARQRVRENAAEVRETTALLTFSRRLLEQRVVAMYKQPSPSLLGLVFQADSFESLVSSLTMMRRIGTSDAELVEEVEATREDLLRRRSRLVGARAAAADLVAAAAAERRTIEATLAARRAALQEARAEVKRLARRIEEEKAEARRREAARLAAQRGYHGPSVPDGDRYTQESWARELLRRAGLPLTAENVRAIVSWEMAEGGHWFNTAYYNPLNTTQPAPGATPMNSVGVKAYTSWDQGFAATITTLRNGFYDGVLAALRRGDSAQAVAAAVGASPWGTGYFTVY